MSQPFDPYYLWLGIPPVEQPPHFYRLLGLRPLESSPAVIDNAAQRVIAQLRGFLNNPAHQPAAQWLIGEVTRASECLLDPAQKATYDSLLASRLSSFASPATAQPETPIVASPAASTPTPLTPRIVAAPVQPAIPVTRPAAARTTPPAKKQELVPQPVKIVLGGIAGLTMGYFIVYFITGNDVFGFLPSRNSPVAERPGSSPEVPPNRAAAPKPAAARPSSPPAPATNSAEKETASTAAPPVPASSPQPTPSSPPAATPAPSFPQRPRTEFTPPPAPTQPLPVNTAPLPGTESASRPSSAKRLPPTLEEQKKMLEELQALYKSDFDKATKADGRPAHVSFLLETARKLRTDPVAQFVLYREAYQKALNLEDLFTVAEVIDELERTFDIDGYVFRMNLLNAAVKAKGPDERTACVHFVLHMADYAAVTGRIEDLGRLAGMAENLARTAPSKEIKAQAIARAAELRKTTEEFAPVSAARQRLAADGNDPAASLIDGKFRCLMQGDWAHGLPLLAQSDHAALAAAAKQDLAGITDAVKPAAIGDAWFDLATADPALNGAYARAQHWYQQAAANLDGLDKVKVEKRLEQIAAMKLPSRLTAKEDTVTLQSARFLLTRTKRLPPTDVLAAITPETYRTTGWSNHTSYFKVDNNAVFARLQAPVNPTGEYQVALRVLRYTSSPAYGPLAIGLPHWQAQFMVVIDLPTPDKRYASYLSLSGLRRPDDNPTLKTTDSSSARIGVGGFHNIHCVVRRREIVISLDGQPLAEYHGDMTKLYLPKEWAVPDSRAMFIGAHQAGFDFHGWAVAPLSADDGSDLPLLTDPSLIRAPIFQMTRQSGQ